MPVSLRLTEEYDPEDWDVYQGKGPMRTEVHYVCTRCDKTRCHFVVETACSGDLGFPRGALFDRELKMPCPLSSMAVFEKTAGPEEVGWERMGEKDD